MSRLIEYVLSLLVAVALVWWALARKVGEPGWVRVRAHEVAVVSDYVRKTSTLVATPGVRWFAPYLQEVHVLDKSPAEFHMQGDTVAGDREVPQLVVRASDGTNFHFEDLTLRYQLAEGQAQLVLFDSGDRERGRFQLVRALARGVLRDELGRYSPEEIVDGATLDGARATAREQLNARLAPHGIVVAEIPAAMPRFDNAYEQQGLRRRVAEQQIALIDAERLALAMEREQRLTKALRETESERARVIGDLTSEHIAAQTEAVELRGEADRYRVERLGAAERERARLETQAEGRRARYESEAEAFAERVAAVGSRGEQAVREAWIQALAKIQIELVPYELPRPEAEEPP